MNEITKYVFGSLSNHENSLKYIYKTIRDQSKTNSRLTFMILTGSMIVFSNAMHISKQNEIIKQLTKEVEQLRKDFDGQVPLEGE